jgi:hypothetical protein
MGTQEEELVRQAIDAVLAKAPGLATDARLLDLRYYFDVDYGGSDAVYITAVMADRPVVGEQNDGAELAAINHLVWDEFVSRRIQRIPHVSFRQEHEPDDDVDLLADTAAPLASLST